MFVFIRFVISRSSFRTWLSMLQMYDFAIFSYLTKFFLNSSLKNISSLIFSFRKSSSLILKLSFLKKINLPFGTDSSVSNARYNIDFACFSMPTDASDFLLKFLLLFFFLSIFLFLIDSFVLKRLSSFIRYKFTLS